MAAQTSENAIYKQLSADMRDSLKNIYKRISTVAEGEARQTDALFTEASDQLREVVKATENAAMSIMEIVEKQLDKNRENQKLLASLRHKIGVDEDLDKLEAISASLGADLSSMFTTLSFQDITGQRIKRVVAALNAIESSVVELYLSSGLIMEGAEKDPARDGGELRAEAQKAVDEFKAARAAHSTLKGPDDKGFSQSAIDDMLAQLGM